MNGDGLPDLIGSSSRNANANTVSVIPNQSGVFGRHIDYPAGVGPGTVLLGDADGDGHPDILVVNTEGNNILALLSNGDGTFDAGAEYNAGAEPKSVTLGDLNGDGVLDAVIASTQFRSGLWDVPVLLGNGDGTFAAKTDNFIKGQPQSVALGDVNGDGKLDLVVSGDSSQDIGSQGDGIRRGSSSPRPWSTPIPGFSLVHNRPV